MYKKKVLVYSPPPPPPPPLVVVPVVKKVVYNDVYDVYDAYDVEPVYDASPDPYGELLAKKSLPFWLRWQSFLLVFPHVFCVLGKGGGAS